MVLKNCYIVTFDFYLTRSKFDSNDEYNSVYAIEYLEECMSVKDKLWKVFRNKIIEISLGSFIIKSKLGSEELKIKLIQEVFGIKTEASEKVKRQFYISRIDEIQFFVPRNKLLELEYLTKVRV